MDRVRQKLLLPAQLVGVSDNPDLLEAQIEGWQTSPLLTAAKSLCER